MPGIQLKISNLNYRVQKSLIPYTQRTILSQISLDIFPGELVAIAGASGTGKSILLESMAGLKKPFKGKILYNDLEISQHYSYLKSFIGYVPQDDILFYNLTVMEMLTYSLKIKATHNDNYSEKVQHIIDKIELTGCENTLIKNLSGGERKRVSIAMVLLSDPGVFILDEPSSGLDPENEKIIMSLLKEISASGITVVISTHSPASVNFCSKVVILGNDGKVCFCGKPKDSLKYFDVNNFASIYNKISMDPKLWSLRFKNSNERIDEFTPMENINLSTFYKESIKLVFMRFIRHLNILTNRSISLITRDTLRTIFLLLQAPVIGIIISMVFKRNSLYFYSSSKQLIFILFTAGIWLGLSNTIQEICKERCIFIHERSASLSTLAYIASKSIIALVFSLVQSTTLILILACIMDFPNNSIIGNLTIELIIGLFINIFTASMLGLLISSIMSNSERIITSVPIFVIIQVVLADFIIGLEGLAVYLSYFTISKWSANAFAVSLDLNNLDLGIEYTKENLVAVEPEVYLVAQYAHYYINLVTNWSILIGFSVVFLILAYVVLRMIKYQRKGG